jgi:hypothetical protein
MTTIVNSTSPKEAESNGFLIGVIILVGFGLLLLYYGIPAIRRMNPSQTIVPTPQVNVPAPQINMPDKIDVNVTQPK